MPNSHETKDGRRKTTKHRRRKTTKHRRRERDESLEQFGNAGAAFTVTAGVCSIGFVQASFQI